MYFSFKNLLIFYFSLVSGFLLVSGGLTDCTEDVLVQHIGMFFILLLVFV